MSLFSVTPRDAPDDPQWLCSAARHWNLDRPDPRQAVDSYQQS